MRRWPAGAPFPEPGTAIMPPDGDRLPASTHVGGGAPAGSRPRPLVAWYETSARPARPRAPQPAGPHSACRATHRWSSSSSDPAPTRCGAGRTSGSFTTPSCFPTARPWGVSCGTSRASTSPSAPPIISSARRSTCTIPTDSASRSMPTGRGRAWQRHGGELTMDTKPLDIQDVIAAGGEHAVERHAGRDGHGPHAPARGKPRPGRRLLS